MAGEVENVGGIGITLEIDDKTDAKLAQIESRLQALVRSWQIVVDVDTPSPKGGANSGSQNAVETKIATSFKSGLDSFTAALKDLKVVIDPASIKSIASAIRESLGPGGPGGHVPYKGTSVGFREPGSTSLGPVVGGAFISAELNPRVRRTRIQDDISAGVQVAGRVGQDRGAQSSVRAGARSSSTRLYRGGRASDSLFRLAEETTLGPGVYATDDRAEALAYAKQRAEGSSNRGRVRTGQFDTSRLLNLAGKKPGANKPLPRAIRNEYRKLLLDAVSDPNSHWTRHALGNMALQSLGDGRGFSRSQAHGFQGELAEIIQKQGYEGLIAWEGGEKYSNRNARSYVFFDPAQMAQRARRSHPGRKPPTSTGARPPQRHMGFMTAEQRADDQAARKAETLHPKPCPDCGLDNWPNKMDGPLRGNCKCGASLGPWKSTANAVAGQEARSTGGAGPRAQAAEAGGSRPAHAVATHRGVDWRVPDEEPAPTSEPKTKRVKPPTYAEQAADLRAAIEERRGRGGKPAWAEDLSEDEQRAKIAEWRGALSKEYEKIEGKEKHPQVKKLYEALNEAKAAFIQMAGPVGSPGGRIAAGWATVPPTKRVNRAAGYGKPRATPAATPAAAQEERAADAAGERDEWDEALSRAAGINARDWLPEDLRGKDADQIRALYKREREEQAERDLGVVAGGALHARIIRRESPVIGPRQMHTKPGQERVPYRDRGEFDPFTGRLTAAIGGTRFVDPHAVKVEHLPSGGNKAARDRLIADHRRQEQEERARLGITAEPEYRRTIPTGRLGEVSGLDWRTAGWNEVTNKGKKANAPSSLMEHEDVLQGILEKVRGGQIAGGFKFSDPGEAAKAAKRSGQPFASSARDAEEIARLATIPSTEMGLYEFVRENGLVGKAFNLPPRFEAFSGLNVTPVSREQVVIQKLMSELGANWDSLMGDERSRSQLKAFIYQVQQTKVRRSLPQSGKIMGPNVPAIGRDEIPMVLGGSRARRREKIYATRSRRKIERDLGLEKPTSDAARAQGILLTEADRAAVTRGTQDIAKGVVPGFDDKTLKQIPDLMSEFALGNMSIIDYQKRLGTYRPAPGSREKLRVGVMQRLQMPVEIGGRGYGRGPQYRLPPALFSLIHEANSWATNISFMREQEAKAKQAVEERKDWGPAPGTAKPGAFQMDAWDANVERIDDPKLTRLFRRRVLLRTSEKNRQIQAKFDAGGYPDKDAPPFESPTIGEWRYKSRSGKRPPVPEGDRKPGMERVPVSVGITPNEADEATRGLSLDEVNRQIQERLIEVAGTPTSEISGPPEYVSRRLAERDVARTALGLKTPAAPVELSAKRAATAEELAAFNSYQPGKWMLGEGELQEHLAGTRKKGRLTKGIPSRAIFEAEAIEAASPAAQMEAAASGAAGAGAVEATAASAARGTPPGGVPPISYLNPPGGQGERVVRVYVVDGLIRIKGSSAGAGSSSEAGATSAPKTKKTATADPDAAKKAEDIAAERDAKRRRKEVIKGIKSYNAAYVPAESHADLQEMYEGLWEKMERKEAKGKPRGRSAEPTPNVISFDQSRVEARAAELRAATEGVEYFPREQAAAERVRSLSGGMPTDAQQKLEETIQKRALHEEYRRLGIDPDEVKEITWGKRVTAKRAENMKLGLPSTPASMETWLRKQVKTDLVAKGVIGKGSIDAFVKDALSYSDVGPKPVTPTKELLGNQALSQISRRYGLGEYKPPSNAGNQPTMGATTKGLDAEIQSRAVEMQKRVGEMPFRALGTSVLVGVSKHIGPFARIEKKKDEAEKAKREYEALAERRDEQRLLTSSRARRAVEGIAAVRQELADKKITPDKADTDITAFRKPVRDAASELKVLVTNTKKTGERFLDLEKQVATGADTIQHFGASFVGGIAGGFIGAMAGMIAQPLIQGVTMAITKIGGPIADSALGFTGTRARVVGELAAATEQKGGIASQAVALKYAYVAPQLTDQLTGKVQAQAETVAATKQLETFRDLWRTADDSGALSGPTGKAAALTGTQGPLGNAFLADYKSVAELISSEFHIARQSRAEETNKGWAQQVQAMMGEQSKYKLTVRPPGPQDEAVYGPMGEAGLRSVYSGGYVFTDKETGKIETDVNNLVGILEAIINPLKRMSPEQIIRGQSSQIAANIGGMQAQRQFTLEYTAPMQRGMNWLGNPQLPYGANWMPGMQNPTAMAMGYAGAGSWQTAAAVGGAMAGMPSVPGASGYSATLGANQPGTGGLVAGAAIPPEAIASFAKYGGAGQDAFNKVAQAAERGIAKLKEAGVSDLTIQSMRDLGGQAAALQTQLAGIQNERTITKYNHDLAIANRSLTDARQLTGQIGKNNSDNVGYYQRQLLLINRASTALSLQLQERQITTQEAVAGFAVQGDTPEIRMARRKEAELEASIARRQLGYSKQTFQTEIKLVDATNLRTVAETAYAVSDMTKDWTAMWDSKAIENTLALIQAALEIPTTEAAAWVGYFSGYKQYMIQLAVEIATATEKSVEDMIGTVTAAVEGLQVSFPWLFGTAKPKAGTGNAGPSLPGDAERGTGQYGPVPTGANGGVTWAPGGYTPVPPAPAKNGGKKGKSGVGVADTGMSQKAQDAWSARYAGYAGSSGGYTPVTSTGTNVVNNNQKYENTSAPVFNVNVTQMNQEAINDLVTQVIKNLNAVLSQVGLRPVAR